MQEGTFVACSTITYATDQLLRSYDAFVFEAFSVVARTSRV